jgi:hypothetical protein
MEPRCVPKRANGNPAAARPPIDWERITDNLGAAPARLTCAGRGAILQVFRSIVCPSPRLAAGGFRGTELTRSRFDYRRCWANFFVSSCSLVVANTMPDSTKHTARRILIGVVYEPSTSRAEKLSDAAAGWV